MSRSIIKILLFVVLVGVFSYLAGTAAHEHEFRAVRRAEGRAIGLFVVGAALALWGDKQVGTFDPISLRGVFIIFGVLLMVFGSILGYALQ